MKIFITLLLFFPVIALAGVPGIFAASLGMGGTMHRDNFVLDAGQLNATIGNLAVDMNNFNIGGSGNKVSSFASFLLGYVNPEIGLGFNIQSQWGKLHMGKDSDDLVTIPNWGMLFNIDYHALATSHASHGLYLALGAGFLQYYDVVGNYAIGGSYSYGITTTSMGTFSGSASFSDYAGYALVVRGVIGSEFVISDGMTLSIDGVVNWSSPVDNLAGDTSDIAINYYPSAGGDVPPTSLLQDNTAVVNIPAVVTGYIEIKFSYNFGS